MPLNRERLGSPLVLLTPSCATALEVAKAGAVPVFADNCERGGGHGR